MRFTVAAVIAILLWSTGAAHSQTMSDADAYRQYAGRLSVQDFKAIKAAMPELQRWKATLEHFRKISVARQGGDLVVSFYQRDFADDPNLGFGNSARGTEQMDIEVLLDPADLRILKSYVVR